MMSAGPLTLTATMWGTIWALCTSAPAETASTGRFVYVTVVTVANGTTASGVSRRLWTVIHRPTARISENNFQVKCLVIHSRFGINSIVRRFEFRAGLAFGDDRGAGFDPLAEMRTEPFDDAPGLGRLDQQGGQEGAQLLQGNTPHKLAFV